MHLSFHIDKYYVLVLKHNIRQYGMMSALKFSQRFLDISIDQIKNKAEIKNVNLDGTVLITKKAD